MKILIFALAASALLLECQGIQPILNYQRSRKLGSGTGFKLPGTARPNSYNLTLNFTLNDSSATASGVVVINLDVDKTSNENILYLNSNVSFAANVNATWNNGKENFSCIIDDTQPEYIILTCDKPITGTNQEVTIPFIPTVSVDSMNGAYVSRFYEEGRKKYIVATQFEQDSARAVFPSFDEPQYKAPISLTLITSSNYSESERIANTKLLSNSTENGWITTTFEQTPEMSVYLLAFVITEDFKNFTENETHAYNFTVFARKTADGYVGTALKYGPQLVDTMGNFTKLPYDQLGNSKLTLAAIPEFAAGAMENWGLITFRETYLIDEGVNTSRKDIQAITEVIAHELTHQWFGDYVTTNWWSETWLNEGFAEYFEYYLTESVLENAEMWNQFVIKEQQPALKVDAYPNSIPLSNNASEVTTESDFSAEFGTISYSKGASIIKMINYTMGEEDFKQGLRKYLKTHAYQNATAADLIYSLQLKETSRTNLSLYLNEWIYEAGYPVLDVSLNTADNTIVHIHPKRFSSSLNKTGENDTSIWWIPLTSAVFTNSSFTATRTIKWLAPGQNETLSINQDDGILVNLQSLGFYRVNYDETLWNRLIVALKNESFGNIDVINRAQLLDDVFNIARSYEGDEQQQRRYYLRAFELAEYLVNETEYHPWYTFFVEVQYLLDRISDEDVSNALKEIVLGLVSKQADVAINATLDNNQTHIQVLRNGLLLNWACKVGHEGCVKWAVQNFQNYTAKLSSIDNNYRDVILCTGLANSQNLDKDFNFTISRLNESTLPLEQSELSKSLGCIKNTTYVSQAVEATLKENKFSRMMYPTILSSLYSSGKKNLIEALTSVLANDLAINEKWQAVSSTESILASIGSKCYSNDCIDALESYIGKYKNDTSRVSVVQAANVTIQTVKTNLKWVEKYGETLISVIEYGGSDPPTTTEITPESTTLSGEKVGFSMILGCSVALVLLANLLQHF